MARQACLMALVLALGWHAPLYAQMTKASISGVVRDESGAHIPGVTVTLKNVDTGIARTVLTDEEGRYSAPNLGLGNYEVQAELAGFRTVVRRGISLSVGRDAIVDLTLQVGELSERILVTGEAPLVETTTSSLGGLVAEKQIVDLPLNGRSIAQLAVLHPGIYAPPGTGSNQFVGRGAKYSFGGGRIDQATFLLDGSDANNANNFAAGGVGGEVLGVETIREFKVLTVNYSAEFGRAAAGVFNAVTKSGTNEFHGSVFEFLRNSALDAKNFFDPVTAPIPPFKRNQFGGTIGGPIRKDRTFFFFGYEGLRERLGVTRVEIMPTAEARQGVLPNPSGPPTRLDVHPAAKPFLDLYPLPNGRLFGDGRGEFQSSFSQPTTEDYWSLRIDHTLSEKDSLFARYTFDDSSSLRAPQRGETLVGFDETNRNQFFTFEERRIFSPELINIAQFSFNRTRRSSNITQFYKVTPQLTAIVPEQQRVRGTDGQPYGATISVANLAGINTGSGFPTNEPYNVFQFLETLLVTRGRHSLKMGMDARRIQFNETKFLRTNGTFRFNSLRDFITGNVDNFSGMIPGKDDAIRGYRQSLFGFYLQDDLRWSPRLTLNLGLRYEFITVIDEVNGKLSNLRSPLDPEISVGPPLFENPSLKNFAPRLGLAWDPSGSGRTSIRTGFGLFFDQIGVDELRASNSINPPFFTIGFQSNPSFRTPFDFQGVRAALTPDIRTIDFRIKTPYLMQYNLGVQREVIPNLVAEFSYIGSRSVKIIRAMEGNTAIPIILTDGREFFQAGSPRRNRPFGPNNLKVSDTNAFYNGLLLSVKRRFADGSWIQGSYTFSKNIDATSGYFNASFVGGEGASSRPSNWKADRGLANSDVRHNLVLNYGYQFPFGQSLGGLARALAKGWRLNGISTITSGAPFTVVLGFNRSNNLAAGLNLHERPNLAPGANPNPVLGGPDRYFDPTVFELQPAGFYGNLGRNTVTGPGLVNFDLSLMKDFSVHETKTVQFRAEFFNLFNRPNFEPPERTNRTVFSSSAGLLNPSAGRLSATANRSRQIQFALKFVF